MNGPLGVMALLLAESAVGAFIVMWATGVWGHVRRGFVLLSGSTATVFAWAAWAAARASTRGQAHRAQAEAVAGGEAAVVGLLALAVALTVWLAVVALGKDRAARALGLVVAAAGPVVLLLLAQTRGDRSWAAFAELALGAVFLGAALHGLLLGHWYIFERRLSPLHMIRSAQWYAAGVAAGAGAAALSAANPPPPLGGFSPFLAVPGFSLYLAVGLVAVCALIAAFVWRLANEGGRSIQAATGLLYLAVIMAFSAELASKFRFFS